MRRSRRSRSPRSFIADECGRAGRTDPGRPSPGPAWGRRPLGAVTDRRRRGTRDDVDRRRTAERDRAPSPARYPAGPGDLRLPGGRMALLARAYFERAAAGARLVGDLR